MGDSLTLTRTSTTDENKTRYELRDAEGNLLESRGISKELWKLFLPGQVRVDVSVKNRGLFGKLITKAKGGRS